MRLSEYFTCLPKQDFTGGDYIRNNEWTCDYEGEWERWAEEAWGEEKRNRHIALSRLIHCRHHWLEELDLSRLGLSCLPILPPLVKTLNASHNKLTGLPSPCHETLVKIDLSFNKFKDIPDSLTSRVQELVLTGNPLDKNLMWNLDSKCNSYIKFEQPPPKSPHRTDHVAATNISWPSTATGKLGLKK
ncbi:hypothetical protein [Sodalis sp. RH16]|uniref:hypothetical protein n=1 Tax=unclassified Sodalis (in: enterobacteria) TaxID=2636512 RepID=UPI0039B446BB